MSVTLMTKTLTREAVKAIAAGCMDKFDLKKTRKNVADYVEPVIKRFTVACALLATMTLLMGVSTVMNISKNGPVDHVTLLGIFAPILIFLVLAFGFIGWLSFGRIRGKFNRALKKGYPELYDELKI
ncbi:MAG: hypothetical protein IJS16_03560 [Butyrivibrio sp.]|nr:hypothetical protein [Butyrivibrio sp.]